MLPVPTRKALVRARHSSGTMSRGSLVEFALSIVECVLVFAVCTYTGRYQRFSVVV